jgi:glycosyltransferase involved in cell wall biosynthesis
MRVLHVVPSYLPAIRYGGPIYSVHALCRALAARGHDVHVFTTNVDGPGISDVPLTEPVAIEGVKVRYFACGLGRRLYRSPAMGQAIKAQVAEFQIVHLHSVFLWPTLAAARTARAARVPYVLAPRGMLVGDLIERKSRILKMLWIRLFERTNLTGAAAIHVTSELERLELEKLKFPLRRVVVIANGIDAPDLTEPFLGSSTTQRPYILSLGRINWKKGLDRLISAMVYVQDADLLIAGNDEENYQPRLEAMVRDLQLSSRVQFLGPVQDAKKWHLMKSASVFAMPSYSENFGIAALEAMVCGCPVVVTPEVGLASAIEQAGAGIAVSGTPEALGATLSALISNPVRRERMGEAGKKLAAQDFSWARIAKQSEELYERCLEERAESA